MINYFSLLAYGNSMRIFIGGATGVLGVRMIPILIRLGHDVAGMTRSQEKMQMLRELVARPILCNVYDLDKLQESVADYRPDLIINMLTDLPDERSDLPAFRKANNRIRTEGTRNMLLAAKYSGSPGFIAQSVAWDMPGEGGEAVKYLEDSVSGYGGTVLRYGQLYGPGTFYENEKPNHPRIHVDRAAEMTTELLGTSAKIIEIVEKEPVS